MKNQRQKLIFRWALTLVVMGALTCLSGCASKKGALKDGIGPDLEAKALALKTFREGAELLFIDNQAALAKFVAASTIDPSMFEAYFNAGVASEALGQDREAIKFYELCLEHKKDQAAALGNLLLVHVRLGELTTANNLVQHYFTQFPEEPFVFVAAAKLALAQNNLADAEKYARAAIEREVENIEALEIMSRVFFVQKKYAAARWVAKNALEHAPAHGGIHLLLGHIFAKLGLLHDALDSYENAVKFLPTEEALESYGLLLMKRGRVSESLPVLTRLVELRPLDYRNHLHLGNAYMANKQFDKAKASYEKALQIDPSQKEINLNLGLLYFDFRPKGLAELDRMKIALDYFQKYLELPGLSKERRDVISGHARTLKDKISYEEESAKESAAAQEEEAAQPKEKALPAEEGPEAPEAQDILNEPAASPAPPMKEEVPELRKDLSSPEEFLDEEPLEPPKKPKPKKEEKAKPKVRKARDEEEDEEGLFDEEGDLEDF